MGAGQRIIEGLKQAAAGDWSRVTIDGKVWECRGFANAEDQLIDHVRRQGFEKSAADNFLALIRDAGLMLVKRPESKD